METPGFGSPLQTYRDNTHRIRVSDNQEGSDPTYLGSLGVVDLDLSLSQDVLDCGLLTTSYHLRGCCQALICCCRILRLAQMGFTMSLSKTCPRLLCDTRAM